MLVHTKASGGKKIYLPSILFAIEMSNVNLVKLQVGGGPCFNSKDIKSSWFPELLNFKLSQIVSSHINLLFKTCVYFSDCYRVIGVIEELVCDFLSTLCEKSEHFKVLTLSVQCSGL